MIISMIAGIGKNYELGKDNKLLWHLPEDLKNFKRLTLNKPIIMGRKTFESLPGILPKRRHIVLTRNKQYAKDGVEIFHQPMQCLEVLKSQGVEEVFIIGGAKIYNEFLPVVDNLYISHVDWQGEADTYFPQICSKSFKRSEVIEHPSVDGSLKWEFVKYEKS